MKKNLKNNLIVIFAGCLLVCIMLFGVFNAFAATSTDFVLQGSIQIDLKTGDTLTVPNGKFGETDAKVYIVTPDGSTYNTNELLLEKGGNYELKYFAQIGGKILTHSENVFVDDSLCFFNDGVSNYSYGLDEKTNRTGIIANFVNNNSQLKFSNIVDLSNTDKDNPAISFTVSPNQIGVLDCKKVYVTFTDVFDENNKVTVAFSFSNSSIWSRCLASANNQIGKGYEYTTTNVLHVGSLGSVFNFTANDSEMLKNQKVGVYFDSTTNKIFLCYYHYSSKTILSTTVVDLDDISIQDEDWDGFTDNNVFVSIACDSIASDFAKLVILTVGEQDLSMETIKDESAPTIVFDGSDFDIDSMPDGIVNKEYSVPDCKCVDYFSGGYLEVEKRVFFNYTRKPGEYTGVANVFSSEVEVVNNKFTPTKTGYYAICYRAKDFSGNQIEKVVGVNVASENPNSLTEISLTPNYQIKGQVGGVVKLASIESFTGQYKITSKYEVLFNGAEKEIYYTGGLGYYFVPENEGTYTVKIIATDFVGAQACSTYECVVEKSNEFFIEEAKLPKYLIENVNYILPKLYAQNINGNKILSNVEVSDGNGVSTYTVGTMKKFKADSNGNAVIKYYVNSVENIYTLPVVAVSEYAGKEIDLTKYFIDENGGFSPEGISLEEKGVKITADSTKSYTFIRNMVANDLRFKLGIENLGVTFNELFVTFTDAIDLNQSVKLQLKVENRNINIYVNDIFMKTLCELSQKANNVEFRYNISTKRLLVGNIGVQISNSVSGEKFSGFGSGEVYLSFGICGESSESYYYLSSINNQSLNSNINRDSIVPVVYTIGNYNSLKIEQNAIVDVLPAIASDVLSAYSKVSVSVLYDGQYMQTVDGKTLNNVIIDGNDIYKVQFSQIGDYCIKYTALDWANKEGNLTYYFHVYDETAPTISLINEPITVASIGAGIIVPNINATDDLTVKENITTFVVVIKPNSRSAYIEQGKKFVFEMDGVYKFYFYAMDEKGNTSVITRYVNVK